MATANHKKEADFTIVAKLGDAGSWSKMNYSTTSRKDVQAFCECYYNKAMRDLLKFDDDSIEGSAVIGTTNMARLLGCQEVLEYYRDRATGRERSQRAILDELIERQINGMVNIFFGMHLKLALKKPGTRLHLVFENEETQKVMVVEFDDDVFSQISPPAEEIPKSKRKLPKPGRMIN